MASLAPVRPAANRAEVRATRRAAVESARNRPGGCPQTLEEFTHLALQDELEALSETKRTAEMHQAGPPPGLGLTVHDAIAIAIVALPLTEALLAITAQDQP